MKNAGIDYGMGTANRDKETGIHYGAISVNSLGDFWYESMESDYGFPFCPHCGEEQKGTPEADEEGEEYCQYCNKVVDEEWEYREEPLGSYYNEDGYEIEYSESLNCLIITKSPYYTLARFCSPCIPGAGDLDSSDPDGVETYCLGIDWFDNLKPSYRVFRVEDNSEVIPQLEVREHYYKGEFVQFQVYVDGEFLTSANTREELEDSIRVWAGWQWDGKII